MHCLGARGKKRGIPDQLMAKNNRAMKINCQVLPRTPEAVEMYTREGGSLSEPATFGVDPLVSDARKQALRLQSFTSSYSFESLFYEVSNNNGEPFVKAFKHLVNITSRLSFVDVNY